jgi:hypothetical protein
LEKIKRPQKLRANEAAPAPGDDDEEAAKHLVGLSKGESSENVKERDSSNGDKKEASDEDEKSKGEAMEESEKNEETTATNGSGDKK